MLHLNCAVKKIEVTDNKVTAVVDQENVTHSCERVFASGGAKETLIDLLEPERSARGVHAEGEGDPADGLGVHAAPGCECRLAGSAAKPAAPTSTTRTTSKDR